jgi:hypothetical protein
MSVDTSRTTARFPRKELTIIVPSQRRSEPMSALGHEEPLQPLGRSGRTSFDSWRGPWV